MLGTWIGGQSYLLEENDAPKDILDDSRNVLGRVHGFTSSDGDGFSSAVCDLLAYSPALVVKTRIYRQTRQ